MLNLLESIERLEVQILVEVYICSKTMMIGAVTIKKIYLGTHKAFIRVPVSLITTSFPNVYTKLPNH